MRRPGMALLALVLAVWLAFPVVSALAGAPESAATSLKLNGVTTTRVKGQLVLSATLVSSDGKPLSGQPVAFYEEVDLLGKRDSYLGTALTDSTGTAVVAFDPTQSGSRMVRVRFLGGEGFAASETSSAIQVRDLVVTFPEEHSALAPVGQWLPYAIWILVLGTWATLTWVFLGTVRGIRSAAGPGDPAAG